MPTLDFKGKQLVYSHHLAVSPRPLKIDAKKSLPPTGKKPSLDDNLIIHGDNLHALKALIPRYAGKVDCIYIDPPYNTGNEKWIYNDNVNSPIMQEWLKDKNPVDGEDLQRHDKWLCMIWPRLQLLRELLAEDGVIFISIDDNEQHRLRMVMDEIFGEKASDVMIWRKSGDSRDGKMKNTSTFRKDHEYIIVGYKKDKKQSELNKIWEIPNFKTKYDNPDDDPRGAYKPGSISNKEEASDDAHKNYYSVTSPSGKRFTRQFNVDQKEFERLNDDKRIYWGKKGDAVPAVKIFLDEKRFVTPYSVLEKGTTSSAKKEMESFFGASKSNDEIGFPTPKPVELVKTLVQLGTKKNSIVLDSFAGSGTTAHAVLALNKEDNSNRKFILVECENYANKITAERTRRVIKGIKQSKDENLKTGLGGSFTYTELGKEISTEKMLIGKSLPDYEALARHLYWTGTGQSIEKIRKTKTKDDLFHESTDRIYYLIYKPTLTFLRSPESALNSTRAARIAKQAAAKKKTAVVFATHKFMGQKELTEMGIVFCQLPFGIN